jgi:CHASE2 domain-containing sensor protein
MKIKKKKTKLLIKDTVLCTIFSYLIIFILSFLVVNISFFDPLKKVVKDFSFLDIYYAENLHDASKLNSEIVLINIEHRDRFEISQLLDAVLEEDPKVVGVDVIFKDKKEAFIDSILAKTLQNKKIISSYIIDKDSLITNHKLFETGKASGFVNLNFDDQESVVRDFVGVTEIDGDTYHSFSAKITEKALGDKKWKKYNYDNKFHGNTPINYIGDYNAFFTFGFDEFMISDNKSVLKDKIVLLGYIGEPTGNVYDVEDKLFTPLNKVTAGKSIPDMFGVVIHANIISMLLNNNLLFRVSDFWIGFITLFCSFFIIMYFIKIEQRGRLTFRLTKKTVLFLFTVIMTGIALWLFKKGIIVHVVPIVAVTLLASSFVKFYKDFIRYIKTKRKWKSYMK